MSRRRGQLENVCRQMVFDTCCAEMSNILSTLDTLLTSRLSNKLRLIHVRSQMAFENAFYQCARSRVEIGRAGCITSRFRSDRLF